MPKEINFDDTKELRRVAKENNVAIISIDTTLHDYPYNGVVIAYRPAASGKDCKMVEVSVSYCAKEDEFINACGAHHALTRMIYNEVVKLPLAEFYRSMTRKAFENNLAKMFLMK